MYVLLFLSPSFSYNLYTIWNIFKSLSMSYKYEKQLVDNDVQATQSVVRNE